tara:strand:+ start:624 stop:941 length:318 start_codon:yes stop_codon:yes gene_type:complete
MSKNEVEITASLGFLKKMWTIFFYLLERLYKIVLFIIVVVIVHYALSVVARRSVYLYSKNGMMSDSTKELLYKFAGWKYPPIIGPSLIVIPVMIQKILFKIRTFI